MINLCITQSLSEWRLRQSLKNGKYGLQKRHKILSLKVPNVKFDFDVTVCDCTLSTDTSKSNSMPYNSVQMSIQC